MSQAISFPEHAFSITNDQETVIGDMLTGMENEVQIRPGSNAENHKYEDRVTMYGL